MLKKYFKKQQNSNLIRAQAISEIQKEFQPVVEKIKRAGKPVVEFTKRKPKRTLYLMIAVIIINFLFLKFFTASYKTDNKGVKFSDIQMKENPFTAATQKNISAPDIAISFDNIRSVNTLKDSLEYLLSKKNKMTYNDTLTFIRIMDKFNALTKNKDKNIERISLEKLRNMPKNNAVQNK